jgi:hypothetical protein
MKSLELIVRGKEVQEEEPGVPSPVAYWRGRDWQRSGPEPPGQRTPAARRSRGREAKAITTSIRWLGGKAG